MEMGANGMAFFSHEFGNETDEIKENSIPSPVPFEETRVVVNQR